MVSISGVAGEVDRTAEPREVTPIGAEPRWARTGLAALLGATAVLYLWGLRGAGWANPYYAAAVQAGTRSWKALLFAALDPGNAITVDKPPAALWLMALSGRIFGFGSWSMLLPQALLGVATVALLYATVRRCSGPAAGLLAGAALALTPVAALMFRYNNPDALLTLLVVLAAYGVVRALGSPGTRWWSPATGWLVLAGAAVGLGFLTKMMQAFLVLPGLALAVLVAAPGGLVVRLARLLTAGVAVVVAAGWYVALVELWPADARPYIGGSTDNSLWELAVDYNGLGRVFGHHAGHPAATGQSAPQAQWHAGAMSGGGPGLTRLLRDGLATEFGWLLPVAVLGLLAGLWLTRRRPRTDADRAGLLLWGGWLLGAGAVLSFMKQSFHTYYTVELAPAVAALAGVGVVLLWRARDRSAARLTLAAMTVTGAAWVFVLLGHTPHWVPWLRWILLIVAAAAAVALVPGGSIRGDASAVRGSDDSARRRGRGLAPVIAGAAVLSVLAGPAVYTVRTVGLPHIGGSPYSGPFRPDARGRTMAAEAPQLDALLAGVTGSRWAAAAVGSSDVSSIELRTGASLLAIGGFSGRDGSPTLPQFRQYVDDGAVRYFLNRPPSPDRRGNRQDQGATSGAEITDWVRAHYTAQRLDGVEVYDLSATPRA
ncbi:ArnT family glycosyltransferase [Nocardia sp. alder85J]|uniref:ArnT family glycosyltransferase n=1 Tax=Nocardia sp. alder85J TaxID=2862949 RepID=UPI001CD2918D|nr:glycosyltransferase family 39 protein [Nocardia sp. alder85J]MCX4097873.1 glycosyltransferase family 39 protein [Nocardia sp. alder85J]